MIKNKIGQFSVVEILFVILLIGSVSGYIFFDFKEVNKDYSTFVESGLDVIYYSEDYRNIIINENLQVGGLTENWNNLELALSDMTNNFELIILDNSDSKVIFSCNETSGKILDERVISVNSGDKFSFRKVRLGVCY